MKRNQALARDFAFVQIITVFPDPQQSILETQSHTSSSLITALATQELSRPCAVELVRTWGENPYGKFRLCTQLTRNSFKTI